MASIDQTDTWRDAFSPSLEAIEQLAREAYGQLPEEFRALCQDLIIEIADFPSDEVFEDMALETNLQAAREVARQLRLRDLGGLVVVDFIDLRSMKNRRAVEKTMKDSLKIDRARSTVGRLSPNGLLEINRQRIQQSLRARAQRACPTCQGTGRVPSIESVGLNLLRRIEGRAATGRLLKARVEMHPELAEAMQNGRRKDLARLEGEYDIEIEIVASHRLHGPEEQIEWRDRQTPITMAPHKAEASVRRNSNQAALAPVVFEVHPAEDAEEDAESTGAAGPGTAADGGGDVQQRGVLLGGRRRRHAARGGTGLTADGLHVVLEFHFVPGVTQKPIIASKIGGNFRKRVNS